MKHTELKGPQGMLTVSYLSDFVAVVLGIPAEHVISTHKLPLGRSGQPEPMRTGWCPIRNGERVGKVQLATPGKDASAPRNVSPPRVGNACAVKRNTPPPSPSHHDTCECPAYAGDPSALAIGTTSPGIKPPENIFAWSKIRPHWQAKTSSGLTTTPFN